MKSEKKNKPLTPDEKLKYEIAEELGLYEQVKSGGWKSLTAKEAGRVGGFMAKRKKDMKKVSETAKGDANQ